MAKILEAKRISPCCKDIICMSLADGVVTGFCRKCLNNIIRINPKNGNIEWLDGESPWTNKELRKVE